MKNSFLKNYSLLIFMVVGIVLGFPLFLLSWKLPGVIAEPVKTVGDLNTSLSMVVTGFHLGGARFSAALACPWTYLTLGLRHLLVPATAVAVLFSFNLEAAEGGRLSLAAIWAASASPVLPVLAAFEKAPEPENVPPLLTTASGKAVESVAVWLEDTDV